MRRLTDMPIDSRIWIYTIERPLTEQEKLTILNASQAFIDEWTSHGAAMDAAIDILFDRFLIISADESKARASGCGIDKSVRFVQHLQDSLNINFFSRTLVYYREENTIESAPIHQFWAMRKAGIIMPKSIVFDSTIQSIHDLKTKFEVPFDESWHQQLWER